MPKRNNLAQTCTVRISLKTPSPYRGAAATAPPSPARRHPNPKSMLSPIPWVWHGMAWPYARLSGVADHFAEDDEHAISITRSIVANLNLGQAGAATGVAAVTNDQPPPVPPQQQQQQQPRQQACDEPLCDHREMGSIIPTDPKKPFDVRKASHNLGDTPGSGLERPRVSPFGRYR